MATKLEVTKIDKARIGRPGPGGQTVDTGETTWMAHLSGVNADGEVIKASITGPKVNRLKGGDSVEL